jgi:hypothetical protein
MFLHASCATARSLSASFHLAAAVAAYNCKDRVSGFAVSCSYAANALYLLFTASCSEGFPSFPTHPDSLSKSNRLDFAMFLREITNRRNR